MFRRRTAIAEPRRGIILLVVLVLLTLFAVVGLTFVYHADAEARAARLARDAQNEDRADVNPELLFSFFLGQLLYDVPDDERGVWSALRGHSLARTMYGLNCTLAPDGSVQLAANDVPFNGTGRLKYPSPFAGLDDQQLINYTCFPADGFVRDPERYGPRPALRQAGAPDNRTPYLGGFNAPYTYPDLNNVFLAAVKADGTVLTPSFHRPWLFGRLTDVPHFPPDNPGNQNWTSREGKYLLLRPRPIDMGPGFPYPEDEGGDVKNLIGAPGHLDPVTGRVHQNDSVWLDLGAPVMTARDGKKYKALFAPLIVDLDGRINLNVHGNLRGDGYSDHASNQGWGPWEVNPGRALEPDPSNPRREWQALLRGNRFGGRYGTDRWPHSAFPGNTAPAGPLPRFYAPADFDASQEQANGTASTAPRLPGTAPTPAFFCFPAPSDGYGSASAAERTGHPLLYHPLRPFAPDRSLGLNNVEALWRHGDTGTEALGGDLLRLCPLTFADPADRPGAARRRRLVTTHSADVDRPGVSPWFWPADANSYNRLAAGFTYPVGYPPPPPATLPIHPDSEFGLDGRAAPYITGLRRLDLNRYLPAYPAPAANGRIANVLGFTVAQVARQHFAAEVFERLCRATGAGVPVLIGLDAERFEAFRRLAQLAVNIVDLIDEDDYFTPFNWFPPTPARPRGEWVYGTELPRVVLNEVYVEYANDPADPGLGANPPAASRFKGNVWVELYNAFRDDPPLTAPWRGGAAVLEVPESAAGARDHYGVYQITIANLTAEPRQPDNARGDVRSSAVWSRLASFSPEPAPGPAPGVDTRVIQPASPLNADGFFGNAAENQGFYVVGPNLDPIAEKDPFPPLAGDRPLATLRRSEMSFRVPSFNPGVHVMPQPSVLLQRLACPHLPPNPVPGVGFNPALPLNPYVTVDYVYRVQPNYAAQVSPDGPDEPPPPPPAQRRSIGRRQPYAGHSAHQQPQQPTPPPLPGQPQHSFFQHNVDATTPGPNWRVPPAGYPAFEWLVHLDRPLVSPVELFHASAFKPHELLQEFLSPADRPGDRRAPYYHRAPWLDEDLPTGSNHSHRLYRALEFFCTHNPSLGTATAITLSPAPVAAGANQTVQPAAMAGVTSTGGSWQIDPGSTLIVDRGTPSEEVVRVKAVLPAGAPRPLQLVADFLKPHAAGFTLTPTVVSERLPGKVNVNTVWDEEVFQALCDPQPPNSFSRGTVAGMFRQLKASRTAGGDSPGPDDRPFLSLAAGAMPSAPPSPSAPPTFEHTMKNTILRSARPDHVPVLEDVTQRHPSHRFELLNKLFNNVTTRSNVFAVWLTVGFFEVTDDTVRPVKLGGELGRAEGRHVRHRMFAIVDRSVLHINPGPQPDFDPRAERSPGARAGRAVPYLSIIH